MNISKRFALISLLLVLLAASKALAQFPVISAEDLRHWVEKKKAVVIDVRIPEEYAEGHIPGAINIAAERIQIEAKRLPRDKATPLIFYCRGAG